MPLGARVVILEGDTKGQHLFAEVSTGVLVLGARSPSSFAPEANVLRNHYLVTLRGESLERLRKLLETPAQVARSGGAVPDDAAT